MVLTTQENILYVYVDGSSLGNPGYAGIGVVFEIKGKILRKISKCVGKRTNNEAEYLAVITALKEIPLTVRKLGIRVNYVMVFSDSTLIVKQLNGEYKVKSNRLSTHLKKIKDITKDMKNNAYGVNIIFKWIEREKNSIADKLAKKGAERCRDAG